MDSQTSEQINVPENLNPRTVSRKFKGIWISAELWLDASLCFTEKCLIAEIDSLDQDDEKGCFASNKYFAKLFGLSEGRIANVLTKLRQDGWVETENFNGRSRKLRVVRDYLTKSRESSLHEKVKGCSRKSEGRPHVKVSGKPPPYILESKVERKEENTTPPLNTTGGENTPSTPVSPSASTTTRAKNLIQDFSEAYLLHFCHDYIEEENDTGELAKFLLTNSDVKTGDFLKIAILSWRWAEKIGPKKEEPWWDNAHFCRKVLSVTSLIKNFQRIAEV